MTEGFTERKKPLKRSEKCRLRKMLIAINKKKLKAHTVDGVGLI